jgi:hypothetical protein
MTNFNYGLGTLPFLSDARTRSICAENPTGEKGGGAHAEPDSPRKLGKGWKIRPCITLDAYSTTKLVDIDGPGVIQHIWFTVKPENYRHIILRFFWDGEKTPSVEVPLDDFFANAGHPLKSINSAVVNSLPVVVNPSGGSNCYWPMPFLRHCTITVENNWNKDIPGFFYQISYALTEIPHNTAYFHAQWRLSTTDHEKPEHLILDGIKGQGHYVGTAMLWTQHSDGWWGEGEIKFFIDDDGEYPTICGTGTEDYFGGAWCFGDTYSTPFLGYPLARKAPGMVPQHGLYRWHIMDPIRFRESLRVTIQALGASSDGSEIYEARSDDIASTAFWYQAEPHAPFPKLPTPDRRWYR